MQHNRLIEPANQLLSNTAIWQVFIVLLTVGLTSLLTYYLSDRSRRKAQFIASKAAVIKYGYLLQQVWSNRLQSELKAYYYEARKNLAKTIEDRQFYAELEKHEALEQPNLSMEISRVYGKLIEETKILQALSSEASYNKIATFINALSLQHKTFVINDLAQNDKRDLEVVEKYNHDGHITIEKILDVEIRQKFNDLDKKLKKVRLRWI